MKHSAINKFHNYFYHALYSFMFCTLVSLCSCSDTVDPGPDAVDPPPEPLTAMPELKKVIEEYKGKESYSENEKGEKVIIKLDFKAPPDGHAKPISDEQLATLKDLKHLEALYLNNCNITDAGLEIISDLKTIKTLYLNNTQITDDGLQHLTELSQLNYILLTDTDISDAGIKHLKEIKSLKNIWLVRTNVTQAGEQDLIAAFDEEIVHVVYHTPPAPPENLSAIKKMISDYRGEAKYLDDKQTIIGSISFKAPPEGSAKPIGDEQLTILTTLKHITGLYLNNCEITDEGLKTIVSIKSIKTLFLNNTKISDEGLQHLKNLSNLNYLLLTDNNITDVGVTHLKEVKSLGYISLIRTKVTEAGAEDLKSGFDQKAFQVMWGDTQ